MNTMSRKIDTTDENWRRLAMAILQMAVEDYKIVLRKLNYNPYNKEAWDEKAEMEKWFNSEYFQILVLGQTTGEVVAREAQKEVAGEYSYA